jgi:hypothetical protein
MPLINRIFNVPIPIIHDNKIAFPKRGYDRRFSSWLPYNAPQIEDDNMSLEDAKKVIDFVFGEFCFKSDQDKTNAIAGFITPFLRGLFKSFSTRTPVFVYEANRERAGKDYCANLTGILYEGSPLEEPPISTGDKFQTVDELKKKLLSAMIYGRKRLHFSNNKGYINNAIFESVTTAEKYSDRILGRSEILTFNNEMDFSLSGNTGMTLTPDLANRCRFVRLFLDIENANARVFKTPDLQGWLKENRNLVLSALYSLVKNWIVSNSPPGKIPFASFQEWAKICGGVLEAAGYGSPCINDIDTSGIAFDTETTEMKTLFEICFEKYPNKWIDRHTIIELVKATEDFGYIDWNNKSDQTKFGLKVVKFVGRIFSDIKLVVKDKSARTARWEYKFENNGNLGNLGNLDYASKPSIIEEKTVGTTLPRLPTLPKQIKQSILSTTSDREVQFYDAQECKDICFKYTKNQVLDWIKENPDGYTNFKQLYEKFGVGSFKIRNQLKDGGLI